MQGVASLIAIMALVACEQGGKVETRTVKAKPHHAHDANGESQGATPTSPCSSPALKMSEDHQGHDSDEHEDHQEADADHADAEDHPDGDNPDGNNPTTTDGTSPSEQEGDAKEKCPNSGEPQPEHSHE